MEIDKYCWAHHYLKHIGQVFLGNLSWISFEAGSTSGEPAAHLILMLSLHETDKSVVGIAGTHWPMRENRMFGTRCMTCFPLHYLIELHLSPNDDGDTSSAISALLVYWMPLNDFGAGGKLQPLNLMCYSACRNHWISYLRQEAFWRFDEFPQGARLHVTPTTYLLQMGKSSELCSLIL